MLTIDALKAYGANTDEGLGRCFGNEAFYLRLVGMGLADANFDTLKTAGEAGDAKAAFDAAHALKGALGNLSLTPLFDPMCAITDKLRGQSQMQDVSALLAEILDQRAKALALME